MRQLLCRKDEAIGTIAVITAGIGGLRFVIASRNCVKIATVIITLQCVMSAEWLKRLVGKIMSLDKF